MSSYVSIRDLDIDLKSEKRNVAETIVTLLIRKADEAVWILVFSYTPCE